MSEGDVYFKKQDTDRIWTEVVIVDKVSDRSYIIQNEQGKYRRTRKHIQKTGPQIQVEEEAYITMPNQNINEDNNHNNSPTGTLQSEAMAERTKRNVQKPVRFRM